MAREVKFVTDSPLERAGFELSVPPDGEFSCRAVSLDIRRGMRHGGRRRGRSCFLLFGEPLHGAGGPDGFDRWRFAAQLEFLGALPVVFEIPQPGMGVLNQSRNCAVESAWSS